MVTVDLITGFLGAGKTTFIHKYIHYLQQQGLRVRIIENEFGAVNVDTQMLQEEDCEIRDLAGLCMCCVGKDAFIQMLQESAKSGCDRILVEPSGIYDVDEFFETMSLPQVEELCEIGSILTIADPMGMRVLTEEAEYLMFAQLLASGMVLLSKTQWMSEDEIEDTLEEINDLMRGRGCEGGLPAEVCTKPWDELKEMDFEDFMDAGYARFVHDRELFSHSEAFQSAEFQAKVSDQEELVQKIEGIFDSPACGVVYRIKGYVKDRFGQRYEVNCTAFTQSIRPVGGKEETKPDRSEADTQDSQQDVLVVIGQHLREKEIQERLIG